LSLKALHDPVFAGYAVQQALQQNNPTNLNYSLSFGSHVISDLAGFSTFYLSPVSNVRWLPTWQFMLALDSYVGSEWISSGVSVNELLSLVENANQPIDSEEAQWFANATQYYHSIKPDFPSIDANQAMVCSSEWSQLISLVTAEALIKPQTCYEQEITFYDPVSRNISNTNEAWDLAKSRFDAYRKCGINAVQLWQSLLIDSDASPRAAVLEIYSQISSCTAPQ